MYDHKIYLMLDTSESERHKCNSSTEIIGINQDFLEYMQHMITLSFPPPFNILWYSIQSILFNFNFSMAIFNANDNFKLKIKRPITSEKL